LAPPSREIGKFQCAKCAGCDAESGEFVRVWHQTWHQPPGNEPQLELDLGLDRRTPRKEVRWATGQAPQDS